MPGLSLPANACYDMLIAFEVSALNMNWSQNSKRFRSIVLLMLLAFFLYRIDLFYGLLTSFLGIISAFIFGLLLALIINLPLRFLERSLRYFDRYPLWLRIRRAACLTLSVLFVLAVVVLILVVIIPEVVVAVETLIRRIPDVLTQLEEWLTGYNTNLRQLLGVKGTDETSIRDFVERAGNFMLGGLSYSSSVVFTAAQLVINLVVGLVFAIYLLFSKERIRGQISTLLAAYLSERHRQSVTRVITMMIDTYSRFLGGQVLQSLVSAALIWMFMLIFGFPYPVLVSLITFICAFIPIFGPYIAGLLGAVLVFTVSPGQAPWFLLMYFVVQQLEGSLIYPRILSNAIDIPSIWVLVAVTVGGGIMGIAGMLLFIPLFAVIYRLLAEDARRRIALKQPEKSHG